jgi:hypothetical protein
MKRPPHSVAPLVAGGVTQVVNEHLTFTERIEYAPHGSIMKQPKLSPMVVSRTPDCCI